MHYGMPVTIEDLVSSAVYMPAFYIYENYKDEAKTQRRTEKEQLVVAEAEVKALAESTHTLEVFNKEWFNKLDLLKKQEERRIKRIRKMVMQ